MKDKRIKKTRQEVQLTSTPNKNGQVKKYSTNVDPCPTPNKNARVDYVPGSKSSQESMKSNSPWRVADLRNAKETFKKGKSRRKLPFCDKTLQPIEDIDKF